MDENDRTERLLALILLNQMKGASQREKIVELSVAGFTNVEIADIVQTTTAVVSQVLYEVRKGRGRSARQKNTHLKTA
jgi:DNA-binding CsgD family transcriptional regulator